MKSSITYKILAGQLLKEYGDLGGAYPMSSVVAGGFVNPGMGTFNSIGSKQNLSAFANNHPTMYYPVGQNKVDMYNSEKATGPSEKDVQELKNKVTPDEILMGVDYEMKRMFNKNKSMAKEIVVKNLKKDPKYYSSLHMLQQGDVRAEGINNMSEKPKVNIQETKKLLDAMIETRRVKTERNVDERVTDAYKDSEDRRKKHYTYK